MNISRTLSGIFLAMIVVLYTVRPVFAQEPSLLPPHIEASRTAYVQTLDAYRVKEQQFIVSREQYKQLQTLASLEEVVRASKDVQLARVDTMIAYFTTLRLYITDLKGAEVTKKAQEDARLQAVLTELGILRTRITDSDDRLSLDNSTAQYESRNQAYVSTAYSALALIKLANIQTATDQLGLLSVQVFDEIKVSSPSATFLSEKQRGYDELARTIDQIKASIQQAFIRLEGAGRENEFNASGYAQIIDFLTSAYSKLKLGESFVKELAR